MTARRRPFRLPAKNRPGIARPAVRERYARRFADRSTGPSGGTRPVGSSRGFTLIEVLVALGIVAIALAAGAQATLSLTRNSQRQSEVLLGALCGENALIQARLSRQVPAIGDTVFQCSQADTAFNVTVTTTATLNANFRRVDVQVRDAFDAPVVRLSTVVGSF